MKRKVVWVTGSSRGIGLEIIKKFAASGYAVVVHGLEEEGAKVAEGLTRQYDAPALFLNQKLTDFSSVQTCLSAIEEKLGYPDVIVSNAGMQFVSSIEEFPVEKWDQILNINLTMSFLLAKAVFPKWKEKRFGRFISIASAHGIRASEFKSAYVASKHGLVGLTKVIALEGAPFGITANTICPGYVDTPMVQGQVEEQAKAHGMPRDEVMQKIILKKPAIKEFVSAESIASIALWLASEEARTTTGTEFVLDGGWSAQ